MVRVTCLSLMKSYPYCSSLLFSFCSLAILDLQSSNDDPSTRGNQRANIQNNKEKIQLRTIHQNKQRHKKNTLNDRARCYGYDNTETQKTELKRRFYRLNGASGI